MLERISQKEIIVKAQKQGKLVPKAGLDDNRRWLKNRELKIYKIELKKNQKINQPDVYTITLDEAF